MAVIRDLLVHVGSEHAPSHAFEWAAALAAERGARLGAVLACAPVQAGLGLSAETAALAMRESGGGCGARGRHGSGDPCHGGRHGPGGACRIGQTSDTGP